MSFLSKANDYELNGEFSDAINLLIPMLSESESDLKDLIQMNLDRIKFKLDCYGEMYSIFADISTIYEHPNNPATYAEYAKKLKPAEYLPIITFTTISSRVARVHETIKCLNLQKEEFHSINLYISEEPKLLDKGISRGDEVLKDIHDLGVNIYCVENIGPYRKFYPIFSQLKKYKAPLETPIITIDDDVLYPKDTFKKFRMIANKYPNSVIAHRGRKITVNSDGFGQYKDYKIPDNINDMLNLGTGKNGILYRYKFFVGQEKKFIGPLIAPAADDLWCKWITAIQGISTVIYEPLAVFDSALDFDESDPNDKVGLYHQINKKGGNDIAFESLVNYFKLSKDKFRY